MPRYFKQSPDSVPTERSTCGFRQRLIRKDDGAPASVTHLKIHDASPHWHNKTHEFYYVTAGRGLMTIDGEEREIAQGDLVHIPPNLVHSLRPVSDHAPIATTVTPMIDGTNRLLNPADAIEMLVICARRSGWSRAAHASIVGKTTLNARPASPKPITASEGKKVNSSAPAPSVSTHPRGSIVTAMSLNPISHMVAR